MSEIFDPSAFLRGLDLAEQLYKDAAVDAFRQLGLAILDDTISESPTVPIEFGTLRASGSAIVVDAEGREELVGTTEGLADVAPGGEPGTPMTSAEGLDVELGGITLIIGYNQPYAARLHEHPEYKFREPGSGAKYVESHIVPRAQEHMEFVAGFIRARVEGGR